MMSPLKSLRSPIIALTLLVYGSVSRAQVVQDNLWTVDGQINAIATSNGIIYVGGSFTTAGPVTGWSVAIDASTGAVLEPYPMATGSFGVETVEPDGNGGWYLGGRFTHVRGEVRTGLAHIDANGNLTPWKPQVAGEVYDIVVSGNIVYVAGFFNNVGGQNRNGLAALDAATGLATDWNPNVGGGGQFGTYVFAIAVSGNTVYAGGHFTTIGGLTRNRIAAIDATTGIATGWNPNAGVPSEGQSVRAIAVDGSTVYVGGEFGNIGGQARNAIAALDAVTGLATSWDPQADNGSWVQTIALSQQTIYVGGGFGVIGGEIRPSIAELLKSNGQATNWNANEDPSADIRSIVLDGGVLYVGGWFFGAIGGQPRTGLAALDANTGLATSWNPRTNTTAYSVAISGGRVFAGGGFWSVGGQPRNNLAAFDAATGVATSWNPDADNIVETLAVSGNTVYAGGGFINIGGQPHSYLTAIDAVTGAPKVGDPTANNTVNVLTVSGGKVYAGGGFTTLGGQSRRFLGAFDATTGATTSWNPNPNQGIEAIAVSGNTLYAGGYFTTIGGAGRNRIAAFDASTGLLTNWILSSNATAIGCVAAGGGKVFLSGNFTSIGGQPRNGFAAIDSSVALASWDPKISPGNFVGALGFFGGKVYVGGYFASIGGWAYNNLAALDAATGQAIYWYPDPDNYVFSIVADGNTVYAGGVFLTVFGTAHANLVALKTVSVTGVEPSVGSLPARLYATPNPTRAGVALSFVLPEKAEVGADVYDVGGHLVRRLEQGTFPAGEQRLSWDGRNDAGREVSTGFYIVRVHAGTLNLDTKVLRLK